MFKTHSICVFTEAQTSSGIVIAKLIMGRPLIDLSYFNLIYSIYKIDREKRRTLTVKIGIDRENWELTEKIGIDREKWD